MWGGVFWSYQGPEMQSVTTNIWNDPSVLKKKPHSMSTMNSLWDFFPQNNFQKSSECSMSITLVEARILYIFTYLYSVLLRKQMCTLWPFCLICNVFTYWLEHKRCQSSGVFISASLTHTQHSTMAPFSWLEGMGWEVEEHGIRFASPAVTRIQLYVKEIIQYCT